MKVKTYQMELRDRIPFLVEENAAEYKAAERITGSAQVVGIMKEVFHLHQKAEEYLYLLTLSTSGELLGVFEVSHGSVNYSLIPVRSIFQRALQVGATQIILVHNHPSGNCIPSKQDKEATERVREAGDLMEIKLVDHIIIGDDYYSFCEKELL